MWQASYRTVSRFMWMKIDEAERYTKYKKMMCPSDDRNGIMRVFVVK